LADVIGSLPSALTAHGVDVRVVLPRYKTIKSARFPVARMAHIEISFDGAAQSAQLLRVDASPVSVTTYFTDAPQYLGRERLY
jgi:starch synthase